MKKTTLETISKVLHDIPGFADGFPGVLEDLDAELNKGAEEKAMRAAAYEGIHRIVVDNLSETPITCADLFTEIGSEIMAKGMTRSNLQYALNNLWQDEIVKIPGKPNTYRRA